MKLSSFSHIVVGETHGFLDDTKAISELLKQVKPGIVLAEALQDLQVTNARELETTTSSKQIDVANTLPWLRRAQSSDIKVYGIDLPHFGMDRHLQQVVSGALEPTPADEAALESLAAHREEHQVRMLRRFKSARPIIIIVGAWHLREGSPLRKALPGCMLIIPKDGQGNALLGPPVQEESARFAYEVNT